MLLKADQGPQGEKRTDVELARPQDVGPSTTEGWRQRFVKEGLEASLQRKEQRNRRARNLEEASEARLTGTTAAP